MPSAVKDPVGDANNTLPGGGEAVLRLVDEVGLEDVARLLRHALAQELIVDLDAGHVPLVPGDHRRLPRLRALHDKRRAHKEASPVRIMISLEAARMMSPMGAQRRLTLLPMSL